MEVFNALPTHDRLDTDFDFVHEMSVQDFDVLDIYSYGVNSTVQMYSLADGTYLHPTQWFIAFKRDKMFNHVLTK